MLKEIELKAKEFENVDEVVKALRNVQTKKSRLSQQKSRKDYEIKMTQLLQEEQLLKEVKNYFEPKKTFVTHMTQSDIEKLNFDETMKAIKSIQSKKCNTQWLENNEDFENACKIEEMLLEHKKNVKPIEENVVKKSTIQNLINHIQKQETKISKEYIIELLEKVNQDQLEF